MFGSSPHHHHPHTAVAAKATTNANHPKLGSKPGNKRATLAAGLAGQPVCMAIQTTQITKAQVVKKINVNQSIKAATLRRSVGSAKAAKVANAGKASRRVCWLDALVRNVVETVKPANHKGNTK